MIVRNALKCKHCGDIIESRYRHDFKFCSCKKIFVDGGHDYLRYGGYPEDMEDLSLVTEDPIFEPPYPPEGLPG